MCKQSSEIFYIGNTVEIIDNRFTCTASLDYEHIYKFAGGCKYGSFKEWCRPNDGEIGKIVGVYDYPDSGRYYFDCAVGIRYYVVLMSKDGVAFLMTGRGLTRVSSSLYKQKEQPPMKYSDKIKTVKEFEEFVTMNKRYMNVKDMDLMDNVLKLLHCFSK